MTRLFVFIFWNRFIVLCSSKFCIRTCSGRRVDSIECTKMVKLLKNLNLLRNWVKGAFKGKGGGGGGGMSSQLHKKPKGLDHILPNYAWLGEREGERKGGARGGSKMGTERGSERGSWNCQFLIKYVNEPFSLLRCGKKATRNQNIFWFINAWLNAELHQTKHSGHAASEQQSNIWCRISEFIYSELSKIFVSLNPQVYLQWGNEAVKMNFCHKHQQLNSCLSFYIPTSIQQLCINVHCQMINAIAELARHPDKQRKKNFPSQSPVAKTLTIQLPSIFHKKIFLPNLKYK